MGEKMKRHTSGPWRVSDPGMVDMRPAGDKWSFWAGLGCSGSGPNPSGQDSGAEIAANARLIAAAPDLLEALKQVTATLALITKDSELVDLARAAISNATTQERDRS